MGGLNAVAAIATVVGTALALGGALWQWAFRPLNERIDGVQGSLTEALGTLHSLEGAMDSTEAQVGGLTEALAPLLAERYAGDPAKMAAVLATFNGTWRGVAAWEHKRHNPLTEAELQRFDSYREKLFDRHQQLNPQEWADFHAMLEKMNHEQQKPPDLAKLFVLSAIIGAVAGIIYGSATRPDAEGGPQQRTDQSKP
jgi:hypothetical protein